LQLRAFQATEGVFLVSSDPELPPPYIGVVGSVHGNEPCGLHVIEGLRDPTHALRSRLTTGTLVLIHGNPEATAQGTRHTRGGVDLNRLFEFRYLDDLPRELWSYEHHRALELRPVLEALDGVLDLHSSTEPTQPFVITGEPRVKLGMKLDCPYVTYGWTAPGLLSDRVLISPLLRLNRPAFSVECGQHGMSETHATAWRVAERYLEIMGALTPSDALSGHPCMVIEVAHRIAKPTLQFTFARPWRGFDHVAADEPLGGGDGVTLIAQEDLRVMLPNQNVVMGEDVFYLGRVIRT